MILTGTIISLSASALTITMSKKTPDGQFSRTYSIEEKSVRLRTNSNYFESFEGVAEFGLFEITNKDELKPQIKRIRELTEALKKINETLGDKGPKYNPQGERIWYVIEGMNVNQYHPYYQDFGKIVNQLMNQEKLSALQTIAVKRTEKGYLMKQSTGGEVKTSNLESSMCKGDSRGTKCTIKGKGYAFLP